LCLSMGPYQMQHPYNDLMDDGTDFWSKYATPFMAYTSWRVLMILVLDQRAIPSRTWTNFAILYQVRNFTPCFVKYSA
jgi:hypothetical protein